MLLQYVLAGEIKKGRRDQALRTAAATATNLLANRSVK
jgi:hypothetical protein